MTQATLSSRPRWGGDVSHRGACVFAKLPGGSDPQFCLGALHSPCKGPKLLGFSRSVFWVFLPPSSLSAGGHGVPLPPLN